MTGTAAADAHAAAATTDTGHAVPPTTAVADDLRVLGSEFCPLSGCSVDLSFKGTK